VIKKFPKITVVTPNFNQGAFLERTILSVLNQNYPNLEYIIIDGGSTDKSVEIIKQYQNRLTFWESKQDKGMYDAINKGFQISTGDIMCWINSDDMLWENSLNYVASIFHEQPNIHWVQGLPSVIDENDELIYQRPQVFSKWFFYLKKHEDSFMFIQQESTFWSRKLWLKSGGKMNLNYQLASDFDLWLRFFRYEKLYCTHYQLGAFRKRVNQQSSNTKLYLKEANSSINENKINLSFKDQLTFMFISFLQKNKLLKSRFFEKLLSFFIGKPSYL
jgi:glycosyltransferase involved in cell wall biosynthesis